ncbi:DUF4340 domain-containing protein [Thalassotalea marina]|uniref:DUF4340 domain-containing protein n=1 Tax=Thalassotalea marina TaxID=1673741 RepID=A0A919BK24_9GAMM|nr:DUF4340 domain-containing protein [Thalassotalea marina]GHF94353.1 hypothetical protein GCM10017161_23240 [Thalassotalea marina]
MNKLVATLACLLIVQLVVAGTLWTVDSDMTQQAERQPLLAFDSSLLNKIEIKSKDDTLSLSMEKGQWQFTEHPDLPVADIKLESLINELSSVHMSWPVAHSKASHERFHVSDDNFEKQLTIYSREGDLQLLNIGKSPSFKQLYVRNANEDEVYLINFNAYQLSADANDWLKKSLLSVEDVMKVEHANISIEKYEERWRLSEPMVLSENEGLNEDDIAQFVDKIANLHVIGIATNGSFKPLHKLTVFNSEHDSFTYEFSKSDTQYYVKRNDVSHWFSIAKNQYEAIAELSFDQFVSKKNGDKQHNTVTTE